MDPTGSFLLGALLQSIYSSPPEGSIAAFTRVKQIKTAAGLVNVSKTKKTLESRADRTRVGGRALESHLSLNKNNTNENLPALVQSRVKRAEA